MSTEHLKIKSLAHKALSKNIKLTELIRKQMDSMDPTPLNMHEVKNYIYYGFSDQTLRPTYWKYLLNHYSENKFKNESYFLQKRTEYNLAKSTVHADMSTCSEDASIIKADLQRCTALRHMKYEIPQPPVESIITVFSHLSRQTSIPYMQGMLSILVPIFYVFYNQEEPAEKKFAEEDSFAVFLHLISERQIFAYSETELSKELDGVTERVVKILRFKDTQLSKHVEDNLLEYSAFIHRWVLFMFSTEFALEKVIWLWDRVFSDAYRFEILEFLCASVFFLLKDILLFQERGLCLSLLQDLSHVDVEVLMNCADSLRRESTKSIH
ncbi:TBC1 domain family member 13 [Enteropsectra breve]|nr:TBC1 domain family member 13 [Enteropsectra breve]